MEQTTKIVALTELELDFHHILYIAIDYIQQKNTTQFSTYLQEGWDQSIQSLFDDAFKRIQKVVVDGSEITYQPDFNVITQIELYHIYSILTVYLKELGEPEFLQYMETNWTSSFREYYWEIYYHFINVVYNYHSILYNDKNTSQLSAIHNYHILLVLLDFVITGGKSNKNDKNYRDQSFMQYLTSNFDASIQDPFFKSYDNIRQELFDYYSKHLNLDDEDDKNMDFILSM